CTSRWRCRSDGGKAARRPALVFAWAVPGHPTTGCLVPVLPERRDPHPARERAITVYRLRYAVLAKLLPGVNRSPPASPCCHHPPRPLSPLRCGRRLVMGGGWITLGYFCGDVIAGSMKSLLDASRRLADPGEIRKVRAGL